MFFKFSFLIITQNNSRRLVHSLTTNYSMRTWILANRVSDCGAMRYTNYPAQFKTLLIRVSIWLLAIAYSPSLQWVLHYMMRTWIGMNFIFSFRKNKIPNSSVVTNGYCKTHVLQMQSHQYGCKPRLLWIAKAKPAFAQGFLRGRQPLKSGFERAESPSWGSSPSCWCSFG